MTDADGSGYGRNAIVPPEDARLTHVGFGSPMGELMRRYWHPVCLSSELADLPRRLRILGEELVAFRDGAGRAGLLGAHCIHRGASLEYGRIEPAGLRCCYHGWLYDAEGRCLDQPGEPEASDYKEKVRQPWYPVEEYRGLVFAYMGPPDRKPLLPHYDTLEQEGVGHVAYRNYSRGEIARCNWLQLQENGADPIHTYALHGYDPGFLGFTSAFAIKPDLEYARRDHSVTYRRDSALPEGRRFIRVVETFVPTVRSVPPPAVEGRDPEKETEGARFIGWWVPVDDENTIGFHIEVTRPDRPMFQRTGPLPDRPYEETQRRPDDREAQVSQRPIAIHALEHLATSDRGVAMFRRLLREAVAAVERGDDPPGVVRDPARRMVRNRARNAVLPAAAGRTETLDEALET